MAATLRASEAGLQQVDRARRLKGWNKTEQAWCDLALTGSATLKRFWRRERIRQELFISICEAVGIEDWQAIADDSVTDTATDSATNSAIDPATDSATDSATDTATPALSAPSLPCFSTYDESTWVGRTELIQTLTERLQQCRLLLLVGLTGIGKTALAERLFAVSASAYRFCALSFDEISAADFASGVRCLLEEKLKISLPKTELTDPTLLRQRLVQTLKTRSYWLQLDSLEVLLTEDDQGGNRFVDPLWLDFFRQLLTTECPSRCVITSQALPGDLGTLATRYAKFWYYQSLSGLSQSEQLDLFQKKGIDCTVAQPLLKQIGSAYEGHPLVLQVIAGEISAAFHGDVQAYWQRYQAELEQIERQQSLRFAPRSRDLQHAVRQRVRQSLRQLPELAQQMFCRSAVYRRPVPIEFWLALLNDASELQQQAAFDTLQDRYLVEWEGNLIRQHNLIRSVAYDLLRTDETIWIAAETKAAQLWRTAYQPELNAGNLEQVRGYLEAFQHYCEVKNWQLAEEVLSVRLHPQRYRLDWQLGLWGYYSEQIRLYSKLLNQSTSETDLLCLSGIGNVYLNTGDYDQAIEYHQRCLALARDTGARWSEARSLNNLSCVYDYLGNYTQMVDLLQQSLTIAREVGDRQSEANALGNLGVAYNCLSDFPQGIEYSEQHVTIAREIGDRWAEGNALGNLGYAYNALGDYLRAIEYFQQQLNIAREVGDRQREGLALGNLADAYHSLKKETEALQCLQQQLTIAREIGDRRGEGSALHNLGGIFNALGDQSHAIDLCQQSLTILRAINDRSGQANALFTLGLAYCGLDKSALAIEAAQQALTIFREIGNRQAEGNILYVLGNMHWCMDNTSRASECFQQSLNLAQTVGDRLTEGNALLGLGKVWLKLQRYSEALEALQTSLQYSQALNNRVTQVDALQQLATLHHTVGRFDQACQFEQQVIAMQNANEYIDAGSK